MEEKGLPEKDLTTKEPPSYNEATTSKDAPPSYEQIFGVSQVKKQVEEARSESSNKGMFAAKLCEIFCGSVACMICVLLLAALPVAMIVIGSIYINDCVGGNRIPIWLIVFGVVSLLQTFTNVGKRCAQHAAKRSGNGDDNSSRSQTVSRSGSSFESLLSGFLLVWIIVGSVWVFGIYDDYQLDRLDLSQCPGCCHPVPYLFSFSILLMIYSIGALFCLILCCCLGGVVFAGAASNDS